MAQATLALCIIAIILQIVQSLSVLTNESSQAREISTAGREGYIIVAGGYNGEFVASCFAYDIGAGTWSTLPDLPTPRSGAALASLENNVYSIAGLDVDDSGNDIFLKEVLELFKMQNAWKEGPPLGIIRGNGVASISLNGSLYALGGDTNHMEKYDCKSGMCVWEQVANSLENHSIFGAAELSGYIYVCGTDSLSRFCERYDPASDAWSEITAMNEERQFFSMVSLNGYVYVIGGADAFNERYDPVNDEWSYFSNVPAQTFGQAAATDGKKIYVVGGQTLNFSRRKDMNVYLPELDIWQKLTPYEIEIEKAGAVFVKKVTVKRGCIVLLRKNLLTLIKYDFINELYLLFNIWKFFNISFYES